MRRSIQLFRGIVLAVCLTCAWAPVQAQEFFRSRAELERWKEGMRRQIRNKEEWIQLNRRDLDQVRRDTQHRDPQARKLAISRFNTLADIIKRGEEDLARLKAELANPPPVLEEEREREEEARQERLRSQQRHWEQQRQEEEARGRQAREQFDRFQQMRRQESQERARQNEALIGSIGEAFSSLFRSGSQAEGDTSAGPTSDRSGTAHLRPREMRLPDTTGVLRQQRERQREREPIQGFMADGEFISSTVVPEEPRSVTESFGGFVGEVARETGRTLGGSLVDSYTTGSDFREQALQQKWGELVSSVESVLPADRQVVYHTLRGDLQRAQAAALELLPPERQLEARASQLPGAYASGRAGDQLGEIWDHHVAAPLGTATAASPRKQEYNELAQAVSGLLDGQREFRSSQSESQAAPMPQSRDHDDSGSDTTRSRVGSGREELPYWRAEYEKQRSDFRTHWDRVKWTGWKDYVPEARTMEEADTLMKDRLRGIEREFKDHADALEDLLKLNRTNP